MKFAQEFKRSLQREGFPQKWIDSAIPYGQLKKCLKKVTNELQYLGLDKDTLAQLAAGDVGFHYELDEETGQSKKHFRPRLTVFVHLQDGVAVDAKLSPNTRDFLLRIASKQVGHREGSPDSSARRSLTPTNYKDISHGDASAIAEGLSAVQQVEVSLVFDAEFFDILQTDVLILDTLQEEEEKRMKGEITALGQVITHTTKPSLGGKAKGDLAKWRDIFELYLDARIFFSTRETDHGARTSTQALKQLQWFQDEVLKRKLVQNLKLEASRDAFSRFLNMNAFLLQNLKFQEINQVAVRKILKKFDKRTALGVAKTFPVVVHSDHLLAGSLAKDLCAQVSSEIISTVPQLDDYLCPICFAVAYWPIRLHCEHIFCSRCLVKMQRKGERFCPLCRGDVIMRAGLDNFDTKHAAFLREYFPKEVKEKVRANELERGKEIFGPDYTDRPCSVM
ncbi:RING-14 protein [Pseudomassariella vexata]|uniref:RING-14 protein n=1 Tax=Pseudomassariella vexata TaxID=1141098 RepID=A0A1Y2E6U4_9PEZI|nr:RING-14 protein [Pseudomassariella vexata]ORY67054.1 RING-14 protein [Pseudomassariella vexata]